MKYLLNRGIFVLMLMSSCAKNDENCKYHPEHTATDTSLFISFEFDGKYYTYYQAAAQETEVSVWNAGPIANSQTESLFYYVYTISFGTIFSDTMKYMLSPSITLNFQNYDTINNNISSHIPKLSEKLQKSYNFVSPPYHPTIKDTAFMNGVSINSGIAGSCLNGSSTELLMLYFSYNLESIRAFYSNESYLRISSKESVCSNYFLIKGYFSTRLLDFHSPITAKNVSNGKFCFLLHK